MNFFQKLFALFLASSIIFSSVPSFSVSRLYDRQTGDVIDADKDDAEFDNTNNAINTHAALTSAHGSNGAILGATSPTMSSPTMTGSATIETAIITSLSALTNGWTNNLGLSYNAGTFTVTDASGGVLSGSNIGWVGVLSNTTGHTVSLQVNTPATFLDAAIGASSDTKNLEWGVTSTSDWANDAPFFLYVVNKGDSNLNGVDGNSMFFISRYPDYSVTPAAASIGDTGAIPGTDNQNSILILADVTTANYAALPCQMIGAFRMRYATATNDWTVQALGNSDGIGEAALAKTFDTLWTMPLAQKGASAGTFLLPNAGQATVFTTNKYFYKLWRNQMVSIMIYLDADGGNDGTAVNTQIALPYQEGSNQASAIMAGPVEVIDGASETFQGHIFIGDSADFFTISYPTSFVADTPLLNSLFTNGNPRRIQTTFSYFR